MTHHVVQILCQNKPNLCFKVVSDVSNLSCMREGNSQRKHSIGKNKKKSKTRLRPNVELFMRRTKPSSTFGLGLTKNKNKRKKSPVPSLFYRTPDDSILTFLIWLYFSCISVSCIDEIIAFRPNKRL